MTKQAQLGGGGWGVDTLHHNFHLLGLLAQQVESVVKQISGTIAHGEKVFCEQQQGLRVIGILHIVNDAQFVGGMQLGDALLMLGGEVSNPANKKVNAVNSIIGFGKGEDLKVVVDSLSASAREDGDSFADLTVRLWVGVVDV